MRAAAAPFVLLAACGVGPQPAAAMSEARRLELRETVREMFYHAYGAYMRLAFPHDELRPISQTHTDSLIELGNAVKPRRERYSGVALTLIDALDTLAVLGNASEFGWAVRWVSEHVSFDQDVDVSLFETNIRVLGGLLSAHLLAAGELPGAEHVAVRGYDGGLLRLARDLGTRMLSAFSGGCTQLPRSFINLRGGKPRVDKQEQCTAGVGTLLLEMGVLSRLSGEPQYEEAALCALRLLWSKRSKIGLLGNTLDVASGVWRNANAGIGAGIDSFYEYLLKGYLVFGRPELFDMWNTSYAAVLTHLRHGAWYAEANMHRGRKEAAPVHFDALQAFWPALQVLVGDIDLAASSHDAFHALWHEHRVLPERYDVAQGKLHAGAWAEAYPLRPELAESAYALYHATGAHVYLERGAEMIASLNAVARSGAAFATVRSVRTRQLDDHMPSFFLAETLKYLYLLYDEGNFVNTRAHSIVFSTEGHLIPLSTRFSAPYAPPAPGAIAPLGIDVADLHEAAEIDKMAVRPLRALISAAGLSSADCLEVGMLRERGRTAAALLRERSESELTRELEARRSQRHEELVCTPDAPPHAVGARAEEGRREEGARASRATPRVDDSFELGGLAVRAGRSGVSVQLPAAATGEPALLWAAARREVEPAALGGARSKGRARSRPRATEASTERPQSLFVALRRGDVAIEWQRHSNGSLLMLGPTHSLAPIADAPLRALCAAAAAAAEHEACDADTTEPCARWAAAGECETNSAHMLRACCASCSRVHAQCDAWGLGVSPTAPPLLTGTWADHSLQEHAPAGLMRAAQAVTFVVLSACELAPALAALGELTGAEPRATQPTLGAIILSTAPGSSGADAACSIAPTMERLVAAGVDLIALPSGMLCSPPAPDAAPEPASQGEGAAWPAGWPRADGPRTLCVPPAVRRRGGGSAEMRSELYGKGQLDVPVPVMLLEPPAVARAAAMLRADGPATPPRSVVIDVAPLSAVGALALGGVAPGPAGGLAAADQPVVSAYGAPSIGGVEIRSREWSLRLRTPSAGHVHAEVLAPVPRTKRGRDEWRLVRELVSVQQESRRYNCHREDGRSDHSCSAHSDCGVSGETCAPRRCSAYSFCYTPD